MATLFSSKRWTNEEPAIYLTGEYQVGTRTSTTVKVRLKLTVSSVTGYNYYGYNIKTRVKLAGDTVSDWITIKGNSPDRWSDPIVKYFPSASGWYTVDQAAANTSMTATFCMDSNAGGRTEDYSGTVKFPVGNTAPTWKNKTSSLTYRGTIAENISSNTFSWGAAYDAQGNTVYYRVKYFIGGKDKGVFGSDNRTSRSFSFNPQSYISAGQSMYFRVYCKDSLTNYGSDYVQSDTMTVNSLTAANITSISAINFDADSFTVTRGNGKNSNGVTSGLTYALSCNACTIYNASNLSETSTDITIYKSGDTPSGPYIVFSALQSWLAERDYASDIVFTLTTTNSYGTTKSSTKTVMADFRKEPTQPGTPVLTGKYTINNEDYWVINRQGITLSWAASSDSNNAAITYLVQYSLNYGTWSTYTTTTNTTAVYSPYPITVTQTVKFRIVAENSYGYSNTSAETEPQTLHYWNPVTITDTTVNRETNSYTVSGKISQNTSISASIRELAISLYQQNDPSTLIATLNPAFSAGVSNYNFSFTVTAVGNVPVLETDTYNLQINAHDQIQEEVFVLNDTVSDLVLSRYSALLTIREKGIGINAVAGDFADLITKGTTVLYGGDVSETVDGSLNLSVSKDSTLNWYIGCYRDAQGVLRSSYLSPAGTTYCFRQIQAVYGDNTALVPLRHRWIYPSNQLAVLKDAVIPDPTYTPWVDFIDESEASLQSARNSMGLGNTLGCLPIENGGTGVTTAGEIATMHYHQRISRDTNGVGVGVTTSGALAPMNGGNWISGSDLGTASYPFGVLYTNRAVLKGSDASLSSTGHGLQIGSTSGANLIFDSNEIIARNNGAPGTLYICGEGANTHISAGGGTVKIGDKSSSITINGSTYFPLGYKKTSVSVTASTGWYVNITGCSGATTSSAVWATFDRDANDGTIWIKSAKCTAAGTIRVWFNVDIALSDTFNICLLWTK